MFNNLTASKILEIVLGTRAWVNYIDSWKTWSQDWANRQNS